MVAAGDFGCGQLRDGNCNGFSLGGDEDNFTTQLDVVLESKNTRNHQFGTITDGINATVLNHDSWEAG